MSKDESLPPLTRDQYDRIKAAAEARGFTVVSKFRPGLKVIRLGDIILSDGADAT